MGGRGELQRLWLNISPASHPLAPACLPVRLLGHLSLQFSKDLAPFWASRNNLELGYSFRQRSTRKLRQPVSQVGRWRGGGGGKRLYGAGAWVVWERDRQVGRGQPLICRWAAGCVQQQACRCAQLRRWWSPLTSWVLLGGFMQCHVQIGACRTAAVFAILQLALGQSAHTAAYSRPA